MQKVVVLFVILAGLVSLNCNRQRESSIIVPGLKPAANLFLEQKIEQLKKLGTEPVVIEAITTANEKNALLTVAEIDSLDLMWKNNPIGNNPQIIEKISNPCANFLKRIQSEQPELLEIFVMDNRGLIVGESNVTSDYNQGDEAKWSEVFGKEAIWYGSLEFDESSRTYGIQISVPVQKIGAICATVNLKNLKER
ncbi:hypothetical protein L0128_08390 [candidate division KSB1 bacterium]|nr:hypothetical protein [candidate division KSB1 bacterium]